jgi:DNA-binding MarR family transcriptional regulator
MPRRTNPMLGDDLVDAYRAFVAEVYDALAAEGFPDLPQAGTTVFRDIEGRGSRVGDLAAQAGFSQSLMRAVIGELEARGYVEIAGDRVRPAERGHDVYAAGQRALAGIEERWERRLGPERFATFREVLEELGRPGPAL